jgi:SAM-dependent methyltransferase
MYKANCHLDKYKETPYCQFTELRPCKCIVANELIGREFDSVLDVGCQWGECLMAINGRFADKKLVGIDIDEKTIELAREITDLDLRVMDASKMDFKPNEFDVVFAEALFCMLSVRYFEPILRKIIQTAKKYIILVELQKYGGIGPIASQGRMGADWNKLFNDYGLIPEMKKIDPEFWGGPWGTNGYIITVQL